MSVFLSMHVFCLCIYYLHNGKFELYYMLYYCRSVMNLLHFISTHVVGLLQYYLFIYTLYVF